MSKTPSPTARWTPPSRDFITIRQWQQGSFAASVYYDNPKTRPLLKPEAIYEIEGGMKLTAFDVSAASAARTRWSNAVSRLFDRFDFLVMPTAQTFAFDINEHWPHQIAGHTMQTYHEWMKATCLISLTGCPSLAVPAGFDARGRAMGLQIVAPIHHEMDCLKLARRAEKTLDFSQAAAAAEQPNHPAATCGLVRLQTRDASVRRQDQKPSGGAWTRVPPALVFMVRPPKASPPLIRTPVFREHRRSGRAGRPAYFPG